MTSRPNTSGASQKSHNATKAPYANASKLSVPRFFPPSLVPPLSLYRCAIDPALGQNVKTWVYTDTRGYMQSMNPL